MSLADKSAKSESEKQREISPPPMSFFRYTNETRIGALVPRSCRKITSQP